MMEEELKKFDEAFEKAKTDKGLMACLVRLVDGATASVKNMDAIAADLYAIGRQAGKSEEEIKMEFKGFAMGLLVNQTVDELDSERKAG